MINFCELPAPTQDVLAPDESNDDQAPTDLLLVPFSPHRCGCQLIGNEIHDVTLIGALYSWCTERTWYLGFYTGSLASITRFSAHEITFDEPVALRIQALRASAAKRQQDFRRKQQAQCDEAVSFLLQPE